MNALVLGAGRSGTSLLASLLGDEATYRGESPLPPSPDNPRGYFEDQGINRLNEAILQSVIRFTRRRWLHRLLPGRFAWPSNGWMALVPLGASPSATAAQRAAIQSHVLRAPFVLKDPRFSYTLPAWRAHLPPTHFVCVFRRPDTVCNSVQAFFARRRLRYSRRFCYAVWRCHYEHLLGEAVVGDWTFIAYESLLAPGGLDRLASALGAPLRRDRMDPALNRSSVAASARDVPAACQELYASLRQRAV